MANKHISCLKCLQDQYLKIYCCNDVACVTTFVSQKTIIRSKGLFWLASRPDQAMVWGQAGGSLKADSAGVWWSSMPFEKRIQYASFIENKEHIEAGWDKTFGDRKTEIVFIGQDMDEAQIRK